MTTVIGFADLVLSALPEDGRLRRDVEEIRRAGERAAGLTRQLLAFSRRQRLEPVRLDPNTVVADAAPLLRRLLGADVEVVTRLPAGLPPIMADPRELQHVLVNLAANARDAMPRGGRLTLETAEVETAAPLPTAHGLLAPGRYVTLAVADTGAGMDAATLARLFEPFFTTKPLGEGTGLGLAAVYGVVEQGGGGVGVESEPGRGSRFTVYLPPVRRLARRVLESRGYAIVEAADGEAGLRACEAHGGSIDLVVTDVVMPRLSGPDMVRRLRAVYPAVRVLYVSAYADATLARNGPLDPEAAFLAKPFTADRLAETVREALELGGSAGTAAPAT
jgi:CheY-like chemotaxis protein